VYILGEKLEELDIEKESGWLYYAKNVDGTLSVFRSKMNRGGGKMDNPEREEIKSTDLKPDYSKYIYYVDGDGDIARAERKNA